MLDLVTLDYWGRFGRLVRRFLVSIRPLCSKSFTEYKTAILLERRSRNGTRQTKEITILKDVSSLL